MTPGEHAGKTVREALGKKADDCLHQVHFVPWICTWFCASSDKHLHLIYNICLFLLDTRTQLKNQIWSVYPEYGYGLLPCFHTFPDIINSICQATVFKFVYPEKVLGMDFSVNIYYALIDICLHIFWTQMTFIGLLLCLIHSCIKVYWNWSKVVYSISLPPFFQVRSPKTTAQQWHGQHLLDLVYNHRNGNRTI